jgi:AraC family transcriptional regulator, positive regulator of tynA and feaB
MESFDTAGLAVHARLDYWNGLHSKVVVPTVTDVTDVSHFAPCMTRTGVGNLWVAQMYSSASVVHHGREHVARTREELFFLKIQLQGSARLAQDGREASLQAGDFTLMDSTRPYHMTFDAPNKMLVFGIPHALLKRQLANPERLVGTSMGYGENLNSILCDFGTRLWRQCELGIDGAGGSLASALLNLTAASYDKLADARALGSTHLEALRLRIIHHIERHLGDCELSPTSIAAMLATSSRYVHSIFTRGDETVSRYILRRRLEESARLLASSSHRSLSVSAIAFDYGFASCTNFGKVFREHYGMTPTEYRHEHCRPVPGECAAHQQ